MSGKCRDCFYWMEAPEMDVKRWGHGVCLVHSGLVDNKTSGITLDKDEATPAVLTAPDFGCVQFRAEE